MGFDIDRFFEKIDDELICSICYSVLEDPVQVVFFNKYSTFYFKYLNYNVVHHDHYITIVSSP